MPTKNLVFEAEWDNVTTRYYDDGTACQREIHGDRFDFAWAVLNGVVHWRSSTSALREENHWSPDTPEAQEAYVQHVSRLVLEEA